MPESNLHISKFSSKVLITIGIIIVFFVILSLLFNIPQLLLLLFISTLIAIFLDTIASYLHRKIKISHSWAIFIVIVLVISFVFIAGYLLGPPVIEKLSKLIAAIPQSIKNLESDLKKSEIGNMILSGTPFFKKGQGGKSFYLFTGIFSSVFGSLIDILLVIVVGIFLAANPGLYIKSLIILLPPKKRNRAREIFKKIAHALRLWLLGRLIVMTSVGILTTCGLYLIGMPFPFVLGLITGVFTFVPYLGAFASYVPVLLIGLSESFNLGLYATIVYVVLHNLEGYILTPIIQEKIISIPPAFIITMQVLMYILFGPLGILIATPLGVVIIILIQTIYIEDILNDKVKEIGEKV